MILLNKKSKEITTVLISDFENNNESQGVMILINNKSIEIMTVQVPFN